MSRDGTGHLPDPTGPGARPRRTTARIATVLLIAAAVCYTSWPLEFPLDVDASALNGFASELSAADQPWSWLFRLADAVAGLLALLAGVLATRSSLGRWPRAAYALLAAFGAFTIADASAPLDCALANSAACRAAEAAGTLSLSHHLHAFTSGFAVAALSMGVAAALVAARGRIAGWIVLPGGGLWLVSVLSQIIVGVQSLRHDFHLLGLVQRTGLVATTTLLIGCALLIPAFSRPRGPATTPSPPR